MINVIKHGKETFHAVCPVCGCEFTYQAEDLKEDLFKNHYVECPDCKTTVSHPEAKVKGIRDITWVEPTPVYVGPGFNNYPDCATCPNKPDPNKPIQVGDTPCTWCIKNRPTCTGIAGGSGGSLRGFTGVGTVTDTYDASGLSTSDGKVKIIKTTNTAKDDASAK